MALLNEQSPIKQHVLTITQLNTYAKSILENDMHLNNLYLTAEISNFKNHYRSGHLYMTLKDEKSSIHAVMFAGNAGRLQFIPEDGMKVLVRGRASLYDRDGQFQVYIDDMQPDGIGALHIAFEQLKEKLEKEGFFSAEFKKEIPKYPKSIAVITSPTGAVIEDIKHVLSRRFPSVQILLYPVKVQGEGAALQIAAALYYINKNHIADTIIVGRGGGSIEDLWAFNEEIVAKAIFKSHIPVISAVGHETDYTIADFVADLRAPTPSAAAELAVPLREESLIQIQTLKEYIKQLLLTSIQDDRLHIQEIRSAYLDKILINMVNNKRLELDQIIIQVKQGIDNKFKDKTHAFSLLMGKLDSLSPVKTLSRGYSMVQKNDKVIHSSKEIQENDILHLTFFEGSAKCKVIEKEDSLI